MEKIVRITVAFSDDFVITNSWLNPTVENHMMIVRSPWISEDKTLGFVDIMNPNEYVLGCFLRMFEAGFIKGFMVGKVNL